MNGLTGGLVSVEDGVKSAEEYAPARKVRVEISFAEKPDGPTTIELLTEAANVANARVAELLGRVTPSVGEQPAPATRKRRTRAEIEADEAAAALKAGASGGGATSADPSAIEDDAGKAGDRGKEDPAEQSAPLAPGPAGMDEWDSPPAEVTDADLNAAVQKKNGALNDPPKIRNLIGAYNPDPTKSFQLREIPQSQRADFLAKLEALK